MKLFSHEHQHSDYLNRGIVAEIDISSVRTLFELGANDGRDTLQLQDVFSADIHAFECHPGMAAEARARYDGRPGIHLVEKAVWHSDARIPFYPVVRTVQNGVEISNPAASSCFRARDDYHQHYEQSVIEVDAIRLDSYCDVLGLERIDMICMDVQGAALHALRGLGDRLHTVRYLVAEIETRPLYHGQDLYPDVAAYLAKHGLKPAARVRRDDWFSDYLFINRSERPWWHRLFA
jgi:FkbM family methyltransferase